VNDYLLLTVVLGLIVLAVLAQFRRSGPPPAESVQRIHAGVSDKAEWMASETVKQQVITDYLAAQSWLAQAQLTNYLYCLMNLPHHFSGTQLIELQRLIKLQMQRNRARFIGILRANHNVTVRRFSEDGLSCLVVDQQSERRMATYDYWSKNRIHTQNLGGGVLVYRMCLDRLSGRWKIDEYIQQLPDGWENLPPGLIKLSDTLPMTVGRDI
jgi:hypothetical protein